MDNYNSKHYETGFEYQKKDYRQERNQFHDIPMHKMNIPNQDPHMGQGRNRRANKKLSKWALDQSYQGNNLESTRNQEPKVFSTLKENLVNHNRDMMSVEKPVKRKHRRKQLSIQINKQIHDSFMSKNW